MNRISILIIISILFNVIIIQAQQLNSEYFKENIEVYFKFEVNSPDQIRELTNIISIDNVDGSTVYAYANETEFNNFLKLNIGYEILPAPGKLIVPEMSSSPREISDWDVYPTYDAYVQMMNDFAANYPSICMLVNAGVTVQGRSILFLKISDNVNVREAEPQFMYTSTMHGDETTGFVLMLRLIDSLLTSYGTDTRITNLIDNTEIWINPDANPDGTYHGGNNTVYGAIRYNANGYDLNRNFPDPEYGVNPNEQPETSVFRSIAEQNNFVLCANFHGGTEVVNYPWDTWTNGYPDYISHPDEAWYVFISHLFADTAQQYSPSNYMNGFDDGITNGGDWYIVHGGRQDYMNYFMNSREVTIEISDTKLLPATQLPAHWNYLRRSFLDYIENILYGVRGIVTDTSGTPLKAKVVVLSHDEMNSEIFTDSINGNYHRMIAPGNYTFEFSSEGYITQTVNNVLVSNFNETILDVQLIPNTIPVEMTSFTANILNNNVLLEWETSTENNNLGFEVQRRRLSDDGQNSEWIRLDFLKGYGTTTETHNYSFTDICVKPGYYSYRLKQIDFDGSFKYSKETEVEMDSPDQFILNQNYPNPFNPSTKIIFQIPQKRLVTLLVFDVLGNEVATLVNEEKPIGYYEIDFNASSLPSGIYFYSLSSGNYLSTKKMILLK